MAFWDLSEGGSATDDGKKEFDGGGGKFDPIPDGSNVLAIIDAVAWANTQQDGSGAEYIKATWSIVSPDEYANRKIFHKIWVTDFDPSAKDDAKALAETRTKHARCWRRLMPTLAASWAKRLASQAMMNWRCTFVTAHDYHGAAVGSRGPQHRRDHFRQLGFGSCAKIQGY